MPTSQERVSSWSCRLPAEIIGHVCEYLVEDEDRETLSSLQLASSATYTLVTPYLFRHIKVNQDTAVQLFGRFGEFPRSENGHFLDAIPNAHLLDLHLAHRLRKFFSQTVTLSLVISEDIAPLEDLEHEGDFEAHLDRYKEVIYGLSAFGGPKLWPSLERCVIDISAGTSHTEAIVESYDFATLFDIMFSKLHPRFMTITLAVPIQPDLIGVDEDFPNWGQCLKKLHADNVDLVDFSPAVDKGMPRATSTLTIRFKNWPEETWEYGPDRLDERIAKVFKNGQALTDVERIRLVGLHQPGLLPPRLAHVDALAITDVEGWADLILMTRSANGNRKDLKIAILPDTSPESETAAIWHTYRQPRRVE